MFAERTLTVDSHAVKPPALIGPNAVLQMAAAMERNLGRDNTNAILAEAGIGVLPTGLEMIAEREAIRLHEVLAKRASDQATAIAIEAGYGTADYIIANRIPAPVRLLLRLLPASLAARLLMRAIKHHAWTFVGAGHFTPDGPWRFSIDREAAGDRTTPRLTLYRWYGAVFARLYQGLVGTGFVCRDITSGNDSALSRQYVIAPERLPRQRRSGYLRRLNLRCL
ncbi:MAG: bacteriochlorophyll 4-vinyl reductase [Pseudomonadota bacterium]